MIGGIGTTELIVIFALVVLLFGANKLPELARSMGTSIGEFKKAQKESERFITQTDTHDADGENEKTLAHQAKKSTVSESEVPAL